MRWRHMCARVNGLHSVLPMLMLMLCSMLWCASRDAPAVQHHARADRTSSESSGALRIVSGGQTGADRAALDVGLEVGLEIGGWVPPGRLAEDGTIPARYPGLREAASPDPVVRTELNVRDSDATVILSHGTLTGGSALTLEFARSLERPILHLDLTAQELVAAASRLREWLALEKPRVLNVAGPRASKDPHIYDATKQVLLDALRT